MKAKKRGLRVLVGLLILSVLAAGGTMFYLNQVMDRSGWVQENGQYYYLDARGNRITGWMTDDDGTYYFGDDHAMVTGWQEIDGQRYWFSSAGQQRNGWVEEGLERWYLPEDGRILNGWQSVDGERRYFRDNQLLHGWQEIDGRRCYLNREGTLVTGWLYNSDGSYHFTETGTLDTGLTQLDGQTYYFYEGSGLMHQGWLDLGTDRYYFGEDGAMVTGWQDIEGSRRFFQEDGALHTGWLQVGENRYYMLEDGTAATEPTVIDGETCFFTPDGIYVLLVNYRYPLPQGYQVDLVRYGEWARVAAIAEQHLRQMILDCRATGIDCWLNCGYRTQDEQTTILNERTAEYMRNGMSLDSAYAKALETVAVPGYSEHQTGLAMDIVCSVDPVWLHEHCWEYGFILRYPEGKSHITNISYEHWHYRYVGLEVAQAMRDTGLCLEEYLGAA